MNNSSEGVPIGPRNPNEIFRISKDKYGNTIILLSPGVIRFFLFLVLTIATSSYYHETFFRFFLK